MQQLSTQPEAAKSPTRLRGFIKGTRRVSLGYCFVRANGQEYFLHMRAIEGGEKQMVSGALVEFTPLEKIPGEDNPRAIDAVVIAMPKHKRHQ